MRCQFIVIHFTQQHFHVHFRLWTCEAVTTMRVPPSQITSLGGDADVFDPAFDCRPLDASREPLPKPTARSLHHEQRRILSVSQCSEEARKRSNAKHSGCNPCRARSISEHCLTPYARPTGTSPAGGSASRHQRESWRLPPGTPSQGDAGRDGGAHYRVRPQASCGSKSPLSRSP